MVINKSGSWNARTRMTSEIIYFSFKTIVFFSCGMHLSDESFIRSPIRKKKKKRRVRGKTERKGRKWEQLGSIVF